MSSRLQLLWKDTTLVTASGSSQSEFMSVDEYEGLVIIKKHTTGDYEFQVEWSTNGEDVDVTETVAVVDSVASEIPVAAPYARFKVNETGGASAFTVHTTLVNGVL